MTLNRLPITCAMVQNRPVRDVAAQYGVSESWLYELLARYRAEGEAAFEPRSRRPHTVSTMTWLDDWSRYALSVTAHARVTGPIVLAVFRGTVTTYGIPASNSRDADTHTRIRHDRIDKTGAVTLRVHGTLHHIAVGRTHARTHVIMLIDDLHVRVVNATTGELLRELTIDTSRNYQPRNQKAPNPLPQVRDFPISCEITWSG